MLTMFALRGPESGCPLSSTCSTHSPSHWAPPQTYPSLLQGRPLSPPTTESSLDVPYIAYGTLPPSHLVFTWPLMTTIVTTISGHVGHARPCAGTCMPGLAASRPAPCSLAPKPPGCCYM